MNTAAYTSPEHVKGIEVDHRSDLFSLGVTFYELLTGQRPFHADDLHTIYYAITAEDPDSPSTLRSDVSPELSGDASERLRGPAGHRPPLGQPLV